MATLCSTLPAEDAAVTREFALVGRLCGLRSAGDLLDFCDWLTPAQRKQCISGARVRVGLKSIEEIETAERLHRARLGAMAEANRRRPMHWELLPGGAMREVFTDGVAERKEADEARAREALHLAREARAAQLERDRMAGAQRERLMRESYALRPWGATQ